MPAGSNASLGGSCLQHKLKTTENNKKTKETKINNND